MDKNSSKFPKGTWVHAPEAEKIPLGEGDSFRLDGRRVAIFHLESGFVAIKDHCPHRGAPLGDGPLEGGVVTCTWHGWEFDLVKGQNVLEEDIKLEKFNVELKSGKVYVLLPPIPKEDL